VMEAAAAEPIPTRRSFLLALRRRILNAGRKLCFCDDGDYRKQRPKNKPSDDTWDAGCSCASGAGRVSVTTSGRMSFTVAIIGDRRVGDPPIFGQRNEVYD